jgi:hypothetical protein
MLGSLAGISARTSRLTIAGPWALPDLTHKNSSDANRSRSNFDEHKPAMIELMNIDRLFNGRHFDREVMASN